MAKRQTAKCPECGEVIEIDMYNEVGDEIACEHCDTLLEITSLTPAKLRVVKGASLVDEDEEGEDYIEEEEDLGDQDEFEDEDKI